MRYIELNPVRAMMIDHPGEYGWSSYAHNAQGHVNTIIKPHPQYTALDSSDCGRQHAYRELFRSHMHTSTVHEIRSALNQDLVVGRDDFKDSIEQMLKRQVRRGKDGRPRVNETAADYYVYPVG